MTSGKVVSPALSPVREKTDTRGRAAILIIVNTFVPKVRSGQLTNCKQRGNKVDKVRCDGRDGDGDGGRLVKGKECTDISTDSSVQSDM